MCWCLFLSTSAHRSQRSVAVVLLLFLTEQHRPLLSALRLAWRASAEAVHALSVTASGNGPSTTNKLSVFCVEHVHRLLPAVLQPWSLRVKMNPDKAVSPSSCVTQS